jgi:MoxR-like ATPase
MDERIVDYIVELVHATRHPADVGAPDLRPLIEFGASPRATIALGQAARAHAFLRGRAFVSPDDVKSIAPDVLRHRVLTSFEADAEGFSGSVGQPPFEMNGPRSTWCCCNRFPYRRLGT